MTETPDEKDELIARLATDNVNLRSTNAALADHRAKLLSENTRLRAAMDKWSDSEMLCEPVAWIDTFARCDLYLSKPNGVDTIPLYTAPQPERKPLTQDQIWASEEIMGLNGDLFCLEMYGLVEVVRAVEAAHGIKEAT